MTEAVLSVRDVGKFFRRYPNRWAQLWEILTGQQRHEPHWVFRGVSFDIAPGEAVGLVGRNGAGKSTLLKLLTGLQAPSEGSVNRRGRVSAILELGVGLHPDFTGRENARQLGLVQGLSQPEAEALLPAVEAFAEIGEYFDEPVHTYSSGMQMRLAFSAATAVQPELLIVDEALAVGDAYFQHKCFERLRALRDAGAAVLLVSHDPSSIRTLCSRALLLHQGALVEDGPPSIVLETYNQLLAPDASRHQRSIAGAGAGRRGGTGEVLVETVAFRQEGEARTALVSEEPAQLVLDVAVREQVPSVTFGILVRDRLGNDVFGTNTHHHGLRIEPKPGRMRVVWDLHGFHLGPGHYSLTVAAHAGAVHSAGNYDWWDRCLTFQVLAAAGPASLGPASLGLTIRCEEVKA
jgi:lipopolysaccharide transport system ATP-binding protein